MAVDYDLVILGGTPEGIEAAQQAVLRGARVALVLQGLDGRRSPLRTLGTLWLTQSPQIASLLPDSPLSPWQRARQQADLAARALTQEDFQQLMGQGVDVIAEVGQVTKTEPFRIDTEYRQLTARSLLLATGSNSPAPQLPGVASVAYETPTAFLQRDRLPESVAILGGTPLALTLSQRLRRWGVAVTIVSPQDNLLSQEDPAVSQWLRAQLQAEGIEIQCGHEVDAIAPDHGEKSAFLSEVAIRAEVLVVATSPVPNLAGMGLEEWLKFDLQQPLRVNTFLQTQQPGVYACGAVVGGYDLPAIARQEARIAVDNALFWNRHRIDYCMIPYDLPTQPEMARVGLTEPQARQRYQPDDLLICHQALDHTPQAHWREATIGFCKLIAHRNGQILGVHGVGPEAREWVQTMALLMVQNTPWWKIAAFPTLPDSLTDLLRQATQQWERDRWQPGRWRRDWAENWCNWRRNR